MNIQVSIYMTFSAVTAFSLGTRLTPPQFSVLGWSLRFAAHAERRGQSINPVVTVLDCSKAFDKCKFSIFFKRLLD